MTTVDTNPRLAAALLYAGLRWFVLPLHTPDEFGACDCPRRTDCPSPGKHPRTEHGLDDATLDQDQVLRWWKIWPQANIGIDLARSGLVDIAPDSLEWFAEFTAQGLPATLSFTSGGGDGHAHHLYLRPEGCAIYRDTQSGRYDLMSAGYAVMPPSLHASQRLYAWREMAGVGPIAPPTRFAPAWVVGHLNRKARPHVEPPEPEDDNPPVELRGEALERWRGRLYERRPTGAVDRSYSLWWLAVVLLEAGCRPRFVEQLLAERDIALGWTKFSRRRDAQRRYSVIVAAAVMSRGPGRVRMHREDPRNDRTQVPPASMTWFSASEVQDLEDETIRWFATGLIGAGLSTELDGKPKKAGKTTLLLALAYAVLHGEEFLGQPTAYTPILYLTEQSGPSFKRNLSRAGLLDRDDLHILFWNRVVGTKWPDIVAEARSKAKETGAGLLIVDTLAQFSGIRGEDENKSGAAMETMEPLQAATTDGLAVLVSRHDRKSGGEVGDSGRGSNAFVGAVDIVLHLQRLPPSEAEGKERQRLLEGISRFEETPDKLLIELHPGEDGERSRYEAIGDQAEVKRQLLSTEILATLSTDPDLAMPGTDLRELLGVRNEELLRELWELMKAHLVMRIGEGRRGSAFRYYRRPPEAQNG